MTINDLSQLRILLWDIDGTLINSTRPGAYKRYFAPAIEKVFGSSGRLAEMQVSGMTDFQIAYEALEPEGFSVEDIRQKMPEMLEVFPVEMRRVLEGEQSHVLVPGTKEVLERTGQDGLFVNALLTGNLEPAAKIKLGKVGLEDHFDYGLSAFGEISHVRADLPFVALEKAISHFGFDFAPSQFVLIGDTPNDIKAARSFGGRVVSVATGRNHPAEELASYNPDVLLENFLDTDRVLEILRTI